MCVLFFYPLTNNNKKIILAKYVVWVLNQVIKLLLPDASDSSQEGLDSWELHSLCVLSTCLYSVCVQGVGRMQPTPYDTIPGVKRQY